MVRISIILGALALMATLQSCDKNDPGQPVMPGPTYADMDVVTGMFLYDANGSPIGTWQEPNSKHGESFVYPNPSTGVIGVANAEVISTIWLLSANCLNDSVTTDILERTMNVSYSSAELDSLQNYMFSLGSGVPTLSLNLSDLAPGFYRLFYRDESDQLFWHNLFIDPTVSNIPTWDVFDEFCD